jgi:hypothetical protein
MFGNKNKTDILSHPFTKTDQMPQEIQEQVKVSLYIKKM